MKHGTKGTLFNRNKFPKKNTKCSNVSNNNIAELGGL